MEREVTWELDPHTKAKHDILRRYLQAWFPILSKYNKRIVYIDGFSGPGEYKGGEDGSPIIALNVAKDHIIDLKAEIVFWFIEKEEKRCTHLRGLIDTIETPKNFVINVECSTFDESLNSTLEDIEKQGQKLAPTFAFIDTFGISDTPFSVVKKIMKYEKCEILITFMSGFLKRFKNEDYNEKHVDKLFGTKDWHHLDEEDMSESDIVEFYQSRLSTVAKYVRSFTMKNNNNQVIYRLLFGTNSYDGLRKMKESMWKVDETGSYTYSDSTDPNQTVLFKIEPDYADLKKLILERFKDKMVSIEDLKKYVVIKTPYRETHIKNQILKPMEQSSPQEITIVSSPRQKKFSYPSGTVIKFENVITSLSSSDKNRENKQRQSGLFDYCD
jgi:three-Cys-motif partner protein